MFVIEMLLLLQRRWRRWLVGWLKVLEVHALYVNPADQIGLKISAAAAEGGMGTKEMRRDSVDSKEKNSISPHVWLRSTAEKLYGHWIIVIECFGPELCSVVGDSLTRPDELPISLAVFVVIIIVVVVQGSDAGRSGQILLLQ